jgi:F-type H+-transporting ATPase subunit a
MEQAIAGEALVNITVNGSQIPLITDAVVTMWVVMAIIVAAILLLTHKLELVPGRRQAAAEIAVDFFRGFANEQIGRHGQVYAAYLGTLLMFLAVSNMISIVNIIPSGSFLSWLFRNPALGSFEFSLHPPTRNFNVTLALALVSIALVIHAEFRYKGVRGWARGFYKPMPIFGFVKALDYVVRPMSLCLRLFGNVMGAVIVMTLLYNMVPIPVVYPAVLGIYFDLFDGGLQAYVFVFLTSIYLSEATEVDTETES